jgi:hypothetical protein
MRGKKKAKQPGHSQRKPGVYRGDHTGLKAGDAVEDPHVKEASERRLVRLHLHAEVAWRQQDKSARQVMRHAETHRVPIAMQQPKSKAAHRATPAVLVRDAVLVVAAEAAGVVEALLERWVCWLGRTRDHHEVVLVNKDKYRSCLASQAVEAMSITSPASASIFSTCAPGWLVTT